MNKKFLQVRGSMFSRIFFSFIIFIVMTIIIVSTILYFNFVQIIRHQLYSSEGASLLQASFSAKIMTDSAKNLALEMYFDNDISKLRYFDNPDISVINAAINKLNSYRLIMPFIQSIYIYNDASKMLYTSLPYGKHSVKHKDNFFDNDITVFLDNSKEYKYFTPIIRKLPIPIYVSEMEYTNSYTFLLFDSPKVQEKINSAIVLNISESWFRGLIDQMNFNEQSSTFIIDNNGIVAAGNKSVELLEDLSGKDFIKTILQSEKNSNYFIGNIEKEKSLIMFVRYAPFNWTFVRTIPYHSVMDKVNSMRNKTIIIATIILVFGIFISIILSSKVYKPIKNVLFKIKVLEEEKKSSFHKLKESFLLNLLKNKFEDNNESMHVHLSNFNIKFNPEGQFILILFELDHFYQFCDTNILKERNLIKFAIMNISAEILSKLGECETADVREDCIAVILEVRTINENVWLEDLKKSIQSVQDACIQYLSVSLTAAISAMGKTFYSLSNLLDETSKSLNYRLYMGHKAIITPDIATRYKVCTPSFPSNLEKTFKEALLLGKKDVIWDIYEQVIHESSKTHYSSFQYTIIHIGFSISNAVAAIESINGISVQYNFNEFITELNRLETLELINVHFSSLFDRICILLADKKSNRHETIVHDTISIINTELSDASLSTERIADRIGISAAYLGRIFRNVTNQTITDYINELRIIKAKALLTNTGLSINEIYKNSGYTNIQYFYKLFKKMNGVTPKEFRNNRPHIVKERE